MAVQNIECKLVQAQLNMIVAGEKFPRDVLEDVDDHLRVCADCRESLEAKKNALRRRVELAAPETVPTKVGAPNVNLGGGIPAAYAPTHAVAQIEDDEPVSEKTIKQWKPVIYSVGLALILVAMSWIARDPTRLFGERASTDFQKPAAPTDQAQSADSVRAQKEELPWVDRPAPKITPPPRTVFVPASPAKSVVKKTARATRPQIRQPVIKAQATNPTGIRVYDSSGKPIQK